jgi:hypothetical protein
MSARAELPAGGRALAVQALQGLAPSEREVLTALLERVAVNLDQPIVRHADRSRCGP